MIAQNGGLAGLIGNYHATIIVHVVGLISILLWMLIRREKLHWNRSTTWPYYMGGVLGVITVVSNSLCFFSLGVSLTLALGLLGQCAAGGIIDHFGLFGLPKLHFRKQHWLSFGIITAGIAMMCIF
jgi:transporter family-2 protein